MRRSPTPTFHQLSLHHRLHHHRLHHHRTFSTSPPSTSASPPSTTVVSPPSSTATVLTGPSFLKWFAGIAAGGSGLGFLYWNSFSSSGESDHFEFLKKSFSALTDWSTAGSVDQLQQSIKKPIFLFGDAYRRRIFFNYEKRMRLRSPPEKVFEYFASFKNHDGEILMTAADLMRAVVPVFPPSESDVVRDGYLRGERSPGELQCAPSEFFMLFDMNNDGLISFKEYIFFVTLLSIPESSFSVAFKMFDIDNNGDIDKDEFKKVMSLMRAHNRQGAFHSDGLRVGLKVSGSVENGGLVEDFFGSDGKTRLHHDKFVQFLRDLHDEISRLEFAHYDYKSRGTISAKDFALSMVASADIRNLNRLLDRVDELDNEAHLSDLRVTLEDFMKFAELRRRLQPFSLALFSFGQVNGLLTRKDFQRAAFNVCGISLNENIIEIIFHVFDTNRDGKLSAQEFIRVVQKREKDLAQPTEDGMFGSLSNFWNSTKKGSLGRLLSS